MIIKKDIAKWTFLKSIRWSPIDPYNNLTLDSEALPNGRAVAADLWHMHWGTNSVGVIDVPLREGCAKYTLRICQWDFMISSFQWNNNSHLRRRQCSELKSLGDTSNKSWVRHHDAELQLRCKELRNLYSKCHRSELSPYIFHWKCFQRFNCPDCPEWASEQTWPV